ncbi:MAG: PHB depolymerase family esterase [Pseudomonadota bacterium]
MTRILIVAVLLACAACGGEPGSKSSTAVIGFAIDRDRITVSGVSSGAYMAGQLHVAYSDVFSGAGMLAGGPFACALGDLRRALGPCLNGGELDIDELVAHAVELAADGLIAPLENLADDTAWLFHSPSDAVVNPETTTGTAAFYMAIGATIVTVDDVAVIHGYPTHDLGAACDAFEAPYINACGYDAAGQLLAALGAGEPPAETASGTLQQIPVANAANANLLESAYLYVPSTCTDGEACGVHVALHGCVQSAELVDDAFATLAGYNRWADSNRLLVIYPQVAASAFAPMNPNGCWDWWGYTGDDYATRSGVQMQAIVNLIETLADRP